VVIEVAWWWFREDPRRRLNVRRSTRSRSLAAEHRAVRNRAVGDPIVACPGRDVVWVLVGHGVIGPHRDADTVAQVDNGGEIVRSYLASFATGDPNAVASWVTADFVNEHLSELGSGCGGRDEYRRRLPGFLSTFVGARYEIVTLAEISTPGAGDVVVRYRFEATYEGTPIDIPGVMWFDVRDGSIARRTDLWDSLTFLRQTGQSSQP